METSIFLQHVRSNGKAATYIFFFSRLVVVVANEKTFPPMHEKSLCRKIGIFSEKALAAAVKIPTECENV